MAKRKEKNNPEVQEHRSENIGIYGDETMNPNMNDATISDLSDSVWNRGPGTVMSEPESLPISLQVLNPPKSGSECLHALLQSRAIQEIENGKGNSNESIGKDRSSQSKDDSDGSYSRESSEGDGEGNSSPIEQPRRIFPSHTSSDNSKYPRYFLLVDHEQDDRAVEIALCSMGRPHMRGFHCAWISFFVAFLCWFSISPLLAEVSESLSLTKQELWTSNILSVTSSAILRILIGPLCDKYGARMCSICILVICGIPTMLIGFVRSYTSLCVIRFVIGFAGAMFVTCQYWTYSMFTREVAGTANALVAGWGNLGGGITIILMGSILFPLFKWIYDLGQTKDDEIITRLLFLNGTVERTLQSTASDRAWRTICVFPGMVALVTAYWFYYGSDDSPKGNYHKRKKDGFISDVNVGNALKEAFLDMNTWLLFIQYGCCFGVEITFSNAAVLYYIDEFELSTEASSAIASIFGFMNLFARGLGGFLSDMSNAWNGMRGRLMWQSIALVCEGLSIILFAISKNMVASIFAMALFSLFVQATEGATFGIVPYVNPRVTGSVVGVVGAGGNVGGIAFSLLFRQLDYDKAFLVMGVCVVASSALSIFIYIKDHAGLFCGKDSPDVRPNRHYRQRRNDSSYSNDSTPMQIRVPVHFCAPPIDDDNVMFQTGLFPNMSQGAQRERASSDVDEGMFKEENDSRNVNGEDFSCDSKDKNQLHLESQ